MLLSFEQKAHDLYDVIESVAYYNYQDSHLYMRKAEHRYGEEECCCCGSPRFSCLIICENCNEIWKEGSEIDGRALDRMSERINEWLDQSNGQPQYSFQRFLVVCSEELDRIFPERKNKDVSNLIHCLREIERKKLMEFDSKGIDVLICSVSQRWNLAEAIYE